MEMRSLCDDGWRRCYSVATAIVSIVAGDVMMRDAVMLPFGKKTVENLALCASFRNFAAYLRKYCNIKE